MTISEIIEAVAECLDRSDTDGACNVIDEQLFRECLADVLALRGGRKLAADIRGVIVAAYHAGAAKRVAVGLLEASQGPLPHAGSPLMLWSSEPGCPLELFGLPATHPLNLQWARACVDWLSTAEPSMRGAR